MNTNFDVSIIVLTYNHENFIEEALESIFAQDSNLHLELIIHNDCSTDKTAKLIKPFLLRNRSNITVRYIEPKVNRFSTGMMFISEILQSCLGTYVAFLEGDDYWTDKLKLQKQFDILESNSNFAICAHAFSRISEGIPSQLIRANANDAGVIPLTDFAEGNKIGTLTVMARRDRIPELPQGYNFLKIGDYPIWGLTTGLEGILYINTEMAHYRVHGNNYFALTSSQFQSNAELESRAFIAANLLDERRFIWINSLVKTIEHYKSEYRDLDIHYQAQIDMRRHFELLSESLSTKGDLNLTHHYELMRIERDHYKELATFGSFAGVSLGVIANLKLLIKQGLVLTIACLNFPLKVVRKVWK